MNLPQSPMADSTQRAIGITAEFVQKYLKHNVAAKLVIASMLAQPDEMTVTFQQEFTDFGAYGSDEQRCQLAHVLASQLFEDGYGPGIQFVEAEEQGRFLSGVFAKIEQASLRDEEMPEVNDDDKSAALLEMEELKFKHLIDLMDDAKPMSPEDAQQLCDLVYRRIMQNKECATQEEISQDYNLLTRLIARFEFGNNDLYEGQLIEYILGDPKKHTDLALKWLNELYAQYQSASLPPIINDESDPASKLIRYSKVLCKLANCLVNRNNVEEPLFRSIFLEAPLITKEALTSLRTACLKPKFGRFALSTLRDMIATREQQRNELLELFTQLSYHEPINDTTVYDVRSHCITIAKELYTISDIQDDLRNLVITISKQLTLPCPPESLLMNCKGLTGDQVEEMDREGCVWDETLVRAALSLFMALLPLDHALLSQLAKITGDANTYVKRYILRNIDPEIRSVDINSPHLLNMIKHCPEGAEPLVIRIVHLLTEKSLPSKKLVKKVKKLHKKRQTDVRSLLPILVGLKHDELVELIPNFVLSATNVKSVPAFYCKLLFGKHIKTQKYLMSGYDLLTELHRCKPKDTQEATLLMQNIDLLLADDYRLSDATITNVVEDIFDEKSLPKPFYHTLQTIVDCHPALRFSFSAFVFPNAIKKHSNDAKLKKLVDKIKRELTNCT